MVVWTPSQWERELDNFAARVRAKDYDRIPYTNWQTIFGFTKLNPSKKIVLAIDSTGKMTTEQFFKYAVEMCQKCSGNGCEKCEALPGGPSCWHATNPDFSQVERVI